MALRICIVDDDRDFADSLAMVLEAEECDTEIAYSAEEAIEVFRKRDFDIAFMDVKLPGKNGVECYLEVRAMRPGARVVMMTGYSGEGLLDQARREGAWATLQKPLDMAQVVRIVAGVKNGVVLVADDDPDFSAGLQDVFERAGKCAFTCKNGQEAIDRVRAGGIDVLLLDLRMPVMDGLETVLALRDSGQEIPTIVVTGYSQEEDTVLARLRELSVRHVVSKPFSPEHILQIVEEALGR